jgi:hypothetical protein
VPIGIGLMFPFQIIQWGISTETIDDTPEHRILPSLISNNVVNLEIDVTTVGLSGNNVANLDIHQIPLQCCSLYLFMISRQPCNPRPGSRSRVYRLSLDI